MKFDKLLVTNANLTNRMEIRRLLFLALCGALEQILWDLTYTAS